MLEMGQPRAIEELTLGNKGGGGVRLQSRKANWRTAVRTLEKTNTAKAKN